MIYAYDPATDERAFAARTTTLQFRALKTRLRPSALVSETNDLPYRLGLRRGAKYAEQDVPRWLMNGWNTEYLLQLNARTFPGEALRHSLHWAFPQAYYAVFAVTLAYFKAVGFTEDTHAGVIRKVGTEMQAGHYPRTLSFLALGGKDRTYLHLDACSLLTPYQFYADSPGVTDTQVVDAHIARFLNATRGLDVRARLKALNLKTVGGKKKTRFTPAEWQRASNKLGPTSLLSLLYRKRIKANYQDIDTFLHPELDAGRVFNALGRCVAAMNFVHEAYIARAVGIASFETWCGRLGEAARPAAARRLVAIRGLR
jgi:hypothetical protein